MAARFAAEVHLVEVVKESLVHATLVTSPSIGDALQDEYGWPTEDYLRSPEFPIEADLPVETLK